MAKVPNAVEILQNVLAICVGHASITDDRQTDGRPIGYSEREHKFTFAKNRNISAVVSPIAMKFGRVIAVRASRGV